jgi:hypothetical protein
MANTKIMCAVMLDTKGPEIRTGNLKDGKPVQLTTGQEITVTTDEKARTLTIEDAGIGMTRDELVKNLGTVAHSGSKALLEELAKRGEGSAPTLIGQFGVGFYSAFIVADKVEVISRKAGEEKAWRWTSDGKSGYELEPAERVKAIGAPASVIKESLALNLVRARSLEEAPYFRGRLARSFGFDSCLMGSLESRPAPDCSRLPLDG